MSNKEIMELAQSCLAPNYNQRPIALVKGKGTAVWDADGKKYLDFTAGIAVNNLGHCYTIVNKAVQKQMTKLGHISNLYFNEPQANYAKALVDKIYKGRVFFCNSGAEANEAALKLARKYCIEKFDKTKTDIIAFERGFHGRTMGALSMTADKAYKEGFGPMVSGVKHVPYNDIEAVEKALTKKTAAIIIEPIQGEGGVHVPTAKYIQKLAKLAAANKTLLIFDEIQTGFGRTGNLFAFQHFKVKPDIVTMSKAVANGFPMGVMFAKEDIAKSLTPGSHATTFGGHPAMCAGALATLEELTKEETENHSREMGRYMLLKLTSMKNSLASIKEVRGMGLLIGIELAYPCAQIVDKCAEMGLLVNCVADRTLRLLPPLTVTRQEIDKALNILNKTLKI